MGIIGILVGGLDSPDDWGSSGWFDPGNVLDFLAGELHSLQEVLAFDRHLDNLELDERMQYWSNRLIENERKIQELFSGENKEQRRELEEFIRRQEKIIAQDLQDQYRQLP